jgi:hypothetical protein
VNPKPHYTQPTHHVALDARLELARQLPRFEFLPVNPTEEGVALDGGRAPLAAAQALGRVTDQQRLEQ